MNQTIDGCRWPWVLWCLTFLAAGAVAFATAIVTEIARGHYEHPGMALPLGTELSLGLGSWLWLGVLASAAAGVRPAKRADRDGILLWALLTTLFCTASLAVVAAGLLLPFQLIGSDPAR